LLFGISSYLPLIYLDKIINRIDVNTINITYKVSIL